MGFELQPTVENKELKGFFVPHNPLDPQKALVETRIEHASFSLIGVVSTTLATRNKVKNESSTAVARPELNQYYRP